ncbi:MAG: RNA 2',3'-cyclic phosphodiesterase [Solirubrobacteraceae bacterium]
MTLGRARLFAALELPPPIRTTLVRWHRAQLGVLDGLRGVDAEALHVTLCFLGSQPVQQIEAIASACRTLACEPPVPLSMGEPRWLPPRRPRVLAIGLRDDERRLAATQSLLSQALQTGGWYEPERPFLGHVTLARSAGGSRVRPIELSPPAAAPFSVTAVALLRSHLGRPGARYERLARVRLKGK